MNVSTIATHCGRDFRSMFRPIGVKTWYVLTVSTQGGYNFADSTQAEYAQLGVIQERHSTKFDQRKTFRPNSTEDPFD